MKQDSRLNRRQFLQLAALFGLAACAPTDNFYPGQTTPDLALQEPPLLNTIRGATVVYAELAAAPLEGTRLAYNGSVPGPTLRIREGDRIRLRFANRLLAHTNLHFHGIPIAPQIDDPFRHMVPGEEYLYEFSVPTGSAGTYWYHPHPHGQVAAQIGAGLAGAIVIEGADEKDLGLLEAEEHLLVLDDALRVNGATRPSLSCKRSQLRLRIVNASITRAYKIALSDHELLLIASDGGLLEKPVAMQEVFLAPGARVEVLVQVKAGMHKLLRLPYDNGFSGAGVETVLLNLTVPADLPAINVPKVLRTIETLDPKKAVQTRSVVFDANFPSQFKINGQAFDEKRTDFAAKADTLEIWDLENQHVWDHPFHLHTYPFQILERNGVPEAYRAWYDVVNLRPREKVKIAIPLRNIVGRTVFHCHIAIHEDYGMMAILEVKP
jgi:FtsP/CotA-like multicopper oxidase with cupredoxin domain